MKRAIQSRWVRWAMIVGAAALLTGCASNGPYVRRQGITGSYVTHDYRTNGQITDSAYPVTVLDRRQIDRSGAGSFADLMRKYPADFH